MTQPSLPVEWQHALFVKAAPAAILAIVSMCSNLGSSFRILTRLYLQQGHSGFGSPLFCNTA